LQNNEFIENIADHGPVFNNFGDMVIKYENCKFENNVAKYGSDFYTRPEKLRLRVYKVNEAFLYLEGISIQNMMKNQETVNYL